MSQLFSSTLLENAVNEFAKLPGIGRKTALRLVLHLLKQSEGEVDLLEIPLSAYAKKLCTVKYATIFPTQRFVIFVPIRDAIRRQSAWWKISKM